MLGENVAPELALYLKHIHEEPASVKRWKKRSYKKSPSAKLAKMDSLEKIGEQVEIGGKKFKEENVAPDILNALKKHEETQVGWGIVAKNGESLMANLALSTYAISHSSPFFAIF